MFQKKASNNVFREVSFFTGRGFWKFFKFCIFLVIPHCISKILLIPDLLQNLSDLPFIIKASKLASVFKAGIDHHLGLLKVKAGNLRGILIVVRAKVEKTTKMPLYQYPLDD